MRTQPHKGYSTKAWNPPRNWVSPERIALTRISAQYRIGNEPASFDNEPASVDYVEGNQPDNIPY